jgi:hypothetical protein
MPPGGVFYDNGNDDDPINCDRCNDLATRSYEAGEFLQLCEDCHNDLGRWLRRG